MRRIQVDMFEVQLGAALLVQFSTPGGTVSGCWPMPG